MMMVIKQIRRIGLHVLCRDSWLPRTMTTTTEATTTTTCLALHFAALRSDSETANTFNCPSRVRSPKCIIGISLRSKGIFVKVLDSLSLATRWVNYKYDFMQMFFIVHICIVLDLSQFRILMEWFNYCPETTARWRICALAGHTIRQDSVTFVTWHQLRVELQCACTRCSRHSCFIAFFSASRNYHAFTWRTECVVVLLGTVYTAITCILTARSAMFVRDDIYASSIRPRTVLHVVYYI